MDPDNWECLMLMSLSLYHLEKYEEAMKDIDSALKIKPDDLSLWEYKHLFLCNLKKFEDAIKCLNQALKIRPDNWECLRSKGICLDYLRKYDEAIECYDQALKINPNDYSSLSCKGSSLNELGLYKEAIECYDQMLNIKPNDYETLRMKDKALEKVNSIAGFSEVTEANEERVNKFIKKKNIPESKGYGGLNNIEVKNIFASNLKKEVQRVVAIQLDFKLTTKFPPQIVDKNRTKKKVLHALEIAVYEKADVVCLPELCLYEDWITEIEQLIVKQGTVVIAGSYYDTDKHNICYPLMDSCANIPKQMKITPSPFEDKGIIKQKMVSGNKLYIYETKIGNFSVLICRDFINLKSLLQGRSDIIFVPSYNEKIKRFHEDANNHINNSPGYIVIANTSFYGGTSVFGVVRKEFNSELVEAGYKSEVDCKNKLCELKKGEEGLIIADLNIIYKSLQVPTPANPEEEIKPVSYLDKKLIEF